MNKTLRIIFVFLLVLIFVLSGAMVTSAANGDVQEKNLEYGGGISRQLGELVTEHYTKKTETGDPYGAEAATCRVILSYKSRVETLMTDGETDRRQEMELLYEKGRAAGVLSWIYYSHNGEKDQETVKSVYEAQLSRIDNATSVGFFTVDGEGNVAAEECFHAMLNTIYGHKIKALLKDGDSEAVRSLIISEANTLGSKCGYVAVDEEGRLGEDGAIYRDHYERVVASVETQRMRDASDAELRAVFMKLYPDERFEYSERLSGYRSGLGIKTTAEGMNGLLYETVAYLLDGLKVDGKVFREEYLSGLSDRTANLVGEENGKTSPCIVTISALFDRFELEMYSADRKDGLAEYAAAQKRANGYSAERGAILDRILSQYVSDGGILDCCEHKNSVDIEIGRATTRMDWFRIYCKTVDEGIGAYGGDHRATLIKAQGVYETTDVAIGRGDRDGDRDVYLRLESDIRLLDALVVEAETIEFKTVFGDIIEKENITAVDKDDLMEALSEGAKLSGDGKKLLSDTLLSLAEKYKKALVGCLELYSNKDGGSYLRTEAMNELSGSVTALKVTDGDGLALDGLVQSGEEILKKAELSDILFSAYEEYLKVKGDKYASEASRLTSAIFGKIKNSEFEDGKRELDGALVSLWRLTALERIYKTAGASDADGVSALLSEAEAKIAELSEKTEIERYTEEAVTRLEGILLSDAVNDACQLIDGLYTGAKDEISKLKYTDAEERKAFSEELELTVSLFKKSIADCADIQRVAEELLRAKTAIEELLMSVREAEKTNCLKDALAVLNSCFGKKEDYTEDNYKKILALLDEYEKKLRECDSVSEYERVRATGKTQIVGIENKLETLQREGAVSLKEVYEGLLAKKQCYSEENLLRLQEIYDRSVSELSAFSSMSELDVAEALINDRTSLMLGVRLDKLFTHDGLFLEGEPELPEDYAPDKNGYSGMIFSDSGFSGDMYLNISSVDGDGIAELIQKSARKKWVVSKYGLKIDSFLLKKLKNCSVVASVDISTGGKLSSGKSYAVSLLLPRDVDVSEIFGVVFLAEDGTVEFFEADKSENGIEFTTDHFSRYYVVSRGEVDLIPWIICLTVILLCQIIAVAILLVRRRKRERDIPLYSLIVPTLLYVRYTPAGAKTVVAVLCVAVAVLGAAIAYLLYGEIKEQRRKRVVAGVRIKEPALEPVGACVGAKDSAQPTLPTLPEETLAEDEEESFTEEEVGSPAEDTAEDDPPELRSVTAEEADELMSDRLAEELKEYEYEYISDGSAKAEINIDVISAAFDDGDTVTLEALKEKRLVGKKVGYVKVLARGRLDKSLTVVAQDFSAAAAKMIFLMGGKAVISRPKEKK